MWPQMLIRKPPVKGDRIGQNSGSVYKPWRGQLREEVEHLQEGRCSSYPKSPPTTLEKEVALSGRRQKKREVVGQLLGTLEEEDDTEVALQVEGCGEEYLGGSPNNAGNKYGMGLRPRKKQPPLLRGPGGGKERYKPFSIWDVVHVWYMWYITHRGRKRKQLRRRVNLRNCRHSC